MSVWGGVVSYGYLNDFVRREKEAFIRNAIRVAL